ncbi:MAG TPA: hypothetical protein VML75_05545 [Kofleriaceae bacterium]|nr:hypothetical protein [Kofleriaceae bacterium]
MPEVSEHRIAASRSAGVMRALMLVASFMLGACLQDMEPSPSDPDASFGQDAATNVDAGSSDAAPTPDAGIPDDGGLDDGGLDDGGMDDGGMDDAGPIDALQL